MKLGCLVVAAVLLSACAYKNPTAPTTPANQPTAGVPARIELGAVPGVGDQGGTGTISARVFDAFAAGLPNQTVAFSASDGELGAPSAVTDEKGIARTTITGPAGAAITIIAAVGSVEQKAQIAMQAKPDAPPPLTPPQFPPPTPPQPPPPPQPAPVPGFSVTLTASPAPIVVNDTVTLTATATATNGAPIATSYAWDCDGNGTAEVTNGSTTQACTYSTAGPITSGVTVRGGTASGSASINLTVLAAAPLAVSIGAPVTVPVVINVSVTFTATLTSTRPVPTNPLEWEWDFGDGDPVVTLLQTGTTPPTATLVGGYGSVGVKTLNLKVTDPLTGRTATGTRTVTVVP